MTLKQWTRTGLVALGLCLGSWAATAQASVITGAPNVNFSNSSYTLSLANDAARYTFSNNANLGDGDIVQAATSDNASLASLFFTPAAYFTENAGPGTQVPFIDGSLASYRSYPNPTSVTAPRDDFYLALRFDLSDGFHYGYARFSTTTLAAYGYQTIPGQGLLAGAGTTPVSEPGSLAMLGLGLALLGLGLAIRRQNRRALAAPAA